MLVSPTGFAKSVGANILAVRVWPAADYTRITLEYRRPLTFSYFTLDHPHRLVVDLQGVELNRVLATLPGKISASDPYVKLIRAGQFKPGVVRLVVELKTEIKPQVFTLKPVAEYHDRLVLDLYPAVPVDPLMELLARANEKPPMAEVAPRESHHRAGRHGHALREQPEVTRLATIVIDPGHGGEDPGATGRYGTHEKTVTLEIARRLKAIIDAQPNMRAVLTRNGDYFIPLGRRVTIARRLQADLFVSIHADAFVRPDARGSSVFILSRHGASSTAARWLARRENEADLIGGVNLGVKDPYLARTLLDLSQTATIGDSAKLASSVLGSLGKVNDLHNGHVERAGFAVLKAPDIPSILVETAFISNPREERRLDNKAYRDKIAEAIFKGIKHYLENNPPLPKSRLALAE